MRKMYVLAIILVFALAIALSQKPLIATANHDAEVVNEWANDLVRKPGDPNYLTLHYRLREMYFSVAPSPSHPTIFLGDSITYGGDWSKLFPGVPVENRGIGGDTTTGLLNRLDEIIAQRPSQIFLMIGTNDLCYDRSIPNIVKNYSIILNRFHSELPHTQIYIQSVLPFNDNLFPSNGLRTNNNIKLLNIELKKLANKYNYPYIDLSSSFTGFDGRLPVGLTSDGLHLSENGYIIWRDQIRGLVGISQK